MSAADAFAVCGSAFNAATTRSSGSEDLMNLSLAQLINLLFLMHGDGGSTGNFVVSFAAALELVGAELIWHKPEPERVAFSQFVQ